MDVKKKKLPFFSKKVKWRCQCGVTGVMWVTPFQTGLADMVRRARAIHERRSTACLDPDITGFDDIPGTEILSGPGQIVCE